MWDPTDLLTVRTLLARGGLEPEALSAELTALGWPQSTWSRNLVGDERRALRSGLQSTPRYRQLQLVAAARARKFTLAYFRQKGLWPDQNWAMVDLGWYGSLQDSLFLILQEVRDGPILGYYFGLRTGREPTPNEREAYFFDERHDSGFVDPLPRAGIYKLMETFCCGDHGGVIGYRQVDHHVEAVLNFPTNPGVLAWGLRQFCEAISCLADRLLLDPDLVDPAGDLRLALHQIMKAYWGHPTAEEAQAFAKLPFDDGLGIGEDNFSLDLAARYRLGHLLRYALRGPLHHRGTWYECGLRLTPQPSRFAVAAVIGLRALAGRLLRALR